MADGFYVQYSLWKKKTTKTKREPAAVYGRKIPVILAASLFYVKFCKLKSVLNDDSGEFLQHICPCNSPWRNFLIGFLIDVFFIKKENAFGRFYLIAQSILLHLLLELLEYLCYVDFMLPLLTFGWFITPAWYHSSV